MAITITNVTEKIAVNGETPIMFGDSGLIQEVFEAVNDGTAVTTNTEIANGLAPRFIQDIRSINATLALSDNLNLAAINSTVTLRVQNAVPANTKYRITLIGRR